MKLKYYLLVLFLITTPALSEAQYLNKIFYTDSLGGFGNNVFFEDSGGYFVIAANTNKYGKLTLFVKRIDLNGIEIFNKLLLSSNVYDYVNNSIYANNKKLKNGNYIVPIMKSIYAATNLETKMSAGLVKLNSNGDTLWMKFYTDNSKDREYVWNCSMMPDGGYVLVGENDFYTGAYQSARGFIIRTDSNGNLLWYKVHPKCNSFATAIYHDGKIIVGGRKYEYVFYNLNYDYYRFRPWFCVYDTMGNLIKDTLYPSGFGGEPIFTAGNIFKDKNGGYFHFGTIDSVIAPLSNANHPHYLAHLDDEFKITWIKYFSNEPIKKMVYDVIQLMDSSYLVTGKMYAAKSWATKINKNGFTIWDNQYYIDSNRTSYLVAADERKDGAYIAFTGRARDGANPAWMKDDVWLLVVDSMGCAIPNCKPTTVNEVPKEVATISIYPNPTTGAFTVNTAEEGVLFIANLQGQTILKKELKEGKNELNMPEVAAGVYIARFTNSGGGMNVARLVYQW